MKERPILFSAPMVRAILDGTKTQTRRAMNPQPVKVSGGVPFRPLPPSLVGVADPAGGVLYRSRYGRAGDRLWVRETWRPFYTDGAIYLADAGTHRLNASSEAEAKRMWPGWKPSIHMPRKHSRLTLEVTGVRVERLQDISEADAYDEGTLEWADEQDPRHSDDTPAKWPSVKAAYRALWESINGAESWAANPWVWVVEFKRAPP